MAVYSYRRVSSLDQADSGLGLDAQQHRVSGYCQQHGLTLVNDFVDAGISGGVPLADRPAGAQLLKSVRKGRAVVVAATLDRLFRSVADAAATIEDFERRGVSLVCLAEGFDMTSPFGKAMAQMASIFAELERSMIRERTRKAMAVKVQKRERCSRYAPYGWDFCGDDLVENYPEQRGIEKILAMRARGMTYRAIAEVLDRSGIRPKRGEKWATCSVEGVCRRARTCAG